ncbi:MAG: HD domain-containing protein [Armatimonadetes bacterium]|nr:HD domain-containing protein [Armatimonadota bacterium]
MKKLYVSNLREGLRVEEIFLVASKSVSSTRGGSPYLKMRLVDRTGGIDAIKWSITESETARLDEDDYILVHATVRSYNDSPQLTIESFQKWGDSIDPADFIRSSDKDPEQMMSALNDLLGQITNQQLKGLLDKIFSDEKLARKFRQAPAAKSVHHAYVSGLLEHTLNVTRACARLADLYPQADRDLLLTGAVLHDIGKIDEYVWTGSIKLSDEGNLVGHIVGGAMMVKRITDEIDGFDPLLSLALQHMILAHHGTREWGSPKLPKSIEALMLHIADDLDAKVAMYEKAIEESDETGERGLFTKRHHLLNHPIFKGHRTRLPNSGGGDEDEEPDLELFTVDNDSDPFAE